ncbi:hypothetical protein Tco_1174711 [Tanacetum coccineum]
MRILYLWEDDTRIPFIAILKELHRSLGLIHTDVGVHLECVKERFSKRKEVECILGKKFNALRSDRVGRDCDMEDDSYILLPSENTSDEMTFPVSLKVWVLHRNFNSVRSRGSLEPANYRAAMIDPDKVFGKVQMDEAHSKPMGLDYEGTFSPKYADIRA